MASVITVQFPRLAVLLLPTIDRRFDAFQYTRFANPLHRYRAHAQDRRNVRVGKPASVPTVIRKELRYAPATASVQQPCPV